MTREPYLSWNHWVIGRKHITTLRWSRSNFFWPPHSTLHPELWYIDIFVTQTHIFGKLPKYFVGNYTSNTFWLTNPCFTSMNQVHFINTISIHRRRKTKYDVLDNVTVFHQDNWPDNHLKFITTLIKLTGVIWFSEMLYGLSIFAIIFFLCWLWRHLADR